MLEAVADAVRRADSPLPLLYASTVHTLRLLSATDSLTTSRSHGLTVLHCVLRLATFLCLHMQLSHGALLALAGLR